LENLLKKLNSSRWWEQNYKRLVYLFLNLKISKAILLYSKITMTIWSL
jgi:hypothetical protein